MKPISFADTLRLLQSLRDLPVKGDEQRAFLQFCLTHITHSRSQFMQDLWVAYELKSATNGYFVEFGGTDGVKFSNTYYLERELGWRGVIAEPARVWYPNLRNNRLCFIDQRCVWTETGAKVGFIQPPIASHSAMDVYANDDMHAATRQTGERYEVETVTLNDLLAFWGAPRRIDYLSLDTEGSELDILKTFDFETYDVRLISVEHAYVQEKRDGIHDLLRSKGFQRKFEKLTDVDDWYVRAY